MSRFVALNVQTYGDNFDVVYFNVDFIVYVSIESKKTKVETKSNIFYVQESIEVVMDKIKNATERKIYG